MFNFELAYFAAPSLAFSSWTTMLSHSPCCWCMIQLDLLNEGCRDHIPTAEQIPGYGGDLRPLTHQEVNLPCVRGLKDVPPHYLTWKDSLGLKCRFSEKLLFSLHLTSFQRVLTTHLNMKQHITDFINSPFFVERAARTFWAVATMILLAGTLDSSNTAWVTTPTYCCTLREGNTSFKLKPIKRWYQSLVPQRQCPGGDEEAGRWCCVARLMDRCFTK